MRTVTEPKKWPILPEGSNHDVPITDASHVEIKATKEEIKDSTELPQPQPTETNDEKTVTAQSSQSDDSAKLDQTNIEGNDSTFDFV